MKDILATTLAFLALLTSSLTLAQSSPLVTVKDPWVRATVPAQHVTGAFMTLTATDDLRLVAVSSPQAGMIEIHQMSMENNVMQMRAMPDGIRLPKGKSVELKPGGYHLMLMDLKQAMKEGTRLPLTLTFEAKDKKRSSVMVSAEIKSMDSKGATAGGMAH